MKVPRKIWNIPSVMVTFVQVKFVPIRNISTNTDPILTKLQRQLPWSIWIKKGSRKFFWPNFFWTKTISMKRTTTLTLMGVDTGEINLVTHISWEQYSQRSQDFGHTKVQTVFSSCWSPLKIPTAIFILWLRQVYSCLHHLSSLLLCWA